MSRFRKPLLFSLGILPIAVAAAIFTCLYQFEMYSAEIMKQAIAQMGSMEMLVIVSVIQTAIYAVVCSFFGYILADKTRLWKPLKFEKSKLGHSMLLSMGLGILFSLDYWTFGNAVSGIKEATAAGMTFNGIAASILYGGIIEEIMLRLFFFSLIAFIIWKLFFRKYDKEHIPACVFIAANIIAAFFFAAGHLPATITIFGKLTPLLLFRCFLLNGGFGLVFGWFYRRYGLIYAMTGHTTVHVVSKIIWFIFIP